MNEHEDFSPLYQFAVREAVSLALRHAGHGPITSQHVMILQVYARSVGFKRDLELALLGRSYEYLVSMSAPKLETLSPLFGEAKPTC